MSMIRVNDVKFLNYQKYYVEKKRVNSQGEPSSHSELED